MDHKQPNPLELSEALRLAQTPAGQQLLSMLQQQSGEDFRKAMELAAAGDYRQAKKAINKFLSTKEAQKLMQQLGR